jgi:hypothetical protein
VRKNTDGEILESGRLEDQEGYGMVVLSRIYGNRL